MNNLTQVQYVEHPWQEESMLTHAREKLENIRLNPLTKESST